MSELAADIDRALEASGIDPVGITGWEAVAVVAASAAHIRPFGRWCEKCEAMVPANHRGEMLMQRKANHDPITLFVREEPS